MSSSSYLYRGAGIRTRDPMLPKHVRQPAALLPVKILHLWNPPKAGEHKCQSFTHPFYYMSGCENIKTMDASIACSISSCKEKGTASFKRYYPFFKSSSLTSPPQGSCHPEPFPSYRHHRHPKGINGEKKNNKEKTREDFHRCACLSIKYKYTTR